MKFPSSVKVFQIDFHGRALQCYESAEQGEHQNTMIMLHGSGGSAAASFWALFPMLATRMRVVTFDFLDPEEGEPVAEFYVDQVRHVVQQVGSGRAVDVFGYSFGAVIAAEFAASDAALVRSLTLLAGWAKTDAQQLLRNDIWRDLYRDAHPALGKYAAFITYGRHFLNTRTSAELQKLIDGAAGSAAREIKMRFNRTVDILTKLPAIQAHTLVIGCEQDQTAPIYHSHVLFGGIDNAKLLEIPAGHGVVHERPAEVASVVQMFVSAPDALPPGSVIANEHA
jgi:pimeloyl-ACP methyl ester carboxylesterase